MEYEKIKQLMDDMGDSKLTSIEIDFPDGTKISMKKEYNNDKLLREKNEVVNSQVNVTSLQVEDNCNQSMGDNGVETGNIVTSPMVGTFYMRPSPNSEPYVEIGKEVKKGDTLCIIEAMKLMNEIECEYTGKISEIYVNDGEPVEYGKKLFKII